MKRYAIIILALALTASAQQLDDAAAKKLSPGSQICQPGNALTWTLQCDPGSRSDFGRIWSPPEAGLEICRARFVGCRQIGDPRGTVPPIPRPGFEVHDAGLSAGNLVAVGFGLGKLLGEEP